jgi:hypothetical protein
MNPDFLTDGRAVETIAPLLPLMRAAELRRVLKIEDEAATPSV